MGYRYRRSIKLTNGKVTKTVRLPGTGLYHTETARKENRNAHPVLEDKLYSAKTYKTPEFPGLFTAFCPYSEILDIGIDYGSLSVGIQFWIYIGKEKVPAKYCHRINRLPFSKKHIRIQYSPVVFDALRERLPEGMRKRFNNCQTALRAFKQ